MSFYGSPSFYGYDPNITPERQVPGFTGCSLISGQGNSPNGQPYSPCFQSLSFGYKGNPIYLIMAVQGGFFDQGGLFVNYDNTDRPVGPPYGSNILRGTWTLVPEPPAKMMALGAALVMCFLKFKS